MQATYIKLADILKIHGSVEHYHVPKYQREYTWRINEWEQLSLDIEENERGYFMGSIIAIDDNKDRGPGQERIFEVIDGQQRLITLSIVLMSIYCRLRELCSESLSSEDKKEDCLETLRDIERQLIYRKEKIDKAETGYFEDGKTKKHCFLRVQPSTQNKNLDDYRHILKELELIKGDFDSSSCGRRKLHKAYCYFYKKLPNNYEEIKQILEKFNDITFVHIIADSSSDAFVLFESLNNRGVPLSAMDIIKNKMLAHLEKKHNVDIGAAFNEWQKLLAYLPEYQDQERFLRQYYNAFKVYSEIKIEKIAKATKSNLIKIYEALIKKNAQDTLCHLLKKAEIYNSFIDPDSSCLSRKNEKRKTYLLDLGRIGSAPSYLFLLYLYGLPSENIKNKESVIDKTLQFFIKYYVRRNVTDFPNTRDLDAINMEVIESCDKYIRKYNQVDGDFIIEKFMNGSGKPSKIEDLKKGLEDNLFSSNADMARFLISKLDEIFHTKEYKPALWARNKKGALIWTVEHILPQGENVPQCWVNMIAEGDKAKVEEIKRNWVHCLGNLTLSAYNSKLSNACFEDKQKLHKDEEIQGEGIKIGYKNGLALNKFPFFMDGTERTLAEIEKWTEVSIEARNNAMVGKLVKLFAFGEELNDLEKEKGHGN